MINCTELCVIVNKYGFRGKNVTGEEEPLHDDVIRDF